MRERDIEAKLTAAARARGGVALKFVSPGVVGVPDRLVLMPSGYCFFVELKAPGRRMRPIQEYRAKQLRALGFKVYVIDKPELIEGLFS